MWSCLLIPDTDMAAERKRHGAQHVRSARKVTVDYKLLSSVSNNNIGMSVTVDIPHRGLGTADAVGQSAYSLERKPEFQYAIRGHRMKHRL